MIVSDIAVQEREARTRVSARIQWEDDDRNPIELYFETSTEHATLVSGNAHAFVVACIQPALHHGERRIRLDAELCPRLMEGLTEAQRWYIHWFKLNRAPITFEAPARTCTPVPNANGRTGLFLSGGIDSLASLRRNQLIYPLNHPCRVRRCLVVYGLDIGWSPEAPAKMSSFDRVLDRLSAVALDTGVSLVPVYTNVRHLHPDPAFWIFRFHGAALASVAHSMGCGLSHVLIAASHDVKDAKPWGSNPVTDPCYSSCDLSIRYDGVLFSRAEKTRLIADWEPGLHSVRVCTTNPPDRLNCGRCEKCLRTMLELMRVGALARSKAFEDDDVSADMLDGIQIFTDHQRDFFNGLLPFFRTSNRQDLIKAVRRLLHRYGRYSRRVDERDWRAMVRRVDRVLFEGHLEGIWRLYRRKGL